MEPAGIVAEIEQIAAMESRLDRSIVGESGECEPVGADPTPLPIEDCALIDASEQRVAVPCEIAATGIQ